MAKTLQLNFTTGHGKNIALTVDEPRTDLTAPEVEAAMQAIIDADVFKVDDYSLEAIKSARIIDRDVTDLIKN